MSRPAPVRAFVGLGSNLGDPAAAVRAALRQLAGLPRTALVGASALYGSAPVDAQGPEFVNAVAELRTRLGAHALLHALQRIERAHGRERPYRNAPRTLDLDLLLYGDAVIDDAELTVPHPRMHERGFVLLPLLELSPGLTIAGLGTVRTLAQGLGGQAVTRIEHVADR